MCGQELSIPTPLLQSKGGVEGAAAAEPERNEAVDAAIVRTMKSRKTLRHQELVHEVLTQIKYFRPDPKLIKRRINALMGEYLRREDPMSATSPYVYVQRRVGGGGGGCIFAFCICPCCPDCCDWVSPCLCIVDAGMSLAKRARERSVPAGGSGSSQKMKCSAW